MARLVWAFHLVGKDLRLRLASEAGESRWLAPRVAGALSLTPTR